MDSDNGIRAREDIAASDKWRLDHIYPSIEAWEADFAAAQAEITAMDDVRAALAPNMESILSTLGTVARLSERIKKLYRYARMLRDEDSRLSGPQALADRAESLSVRASASAAFLTPALLQMPEALLHECAVSPTFADYDRQLLEVLRSRPHTLPAEQEVLLARADEIGGGPEAIYTLLTSADISFPTITGEDGQPMSVNDARLLTFLSSRDGRVRREAYETVLGTYGKLGNTFAAIYASSVKYDVFTAQARKFGSAREASLFASEIPVPVYDALLEAVYERLPALNRYQATKQKALGLSELHLWDLYVDTAKDFEMKLTYDEAYALVLEALAPLGEDYVGTVTEAKTAGWVDIYENAGKHHGAYSWGTYGVHPYVLLNFRGTLDAASTLAHELGHAMHSYYSGQTQPATKVDYSLFAAEVASTVNEILLSCYLLEKHPEKEAQQSLLGTLLEQFRQTVFRQSLFAAFEMEAHAMQERGEPLTREALSDLHYRLNEKFYGRACIIDDVVRNEWMRIPHFYRAFYVYQYSTGFSAAVCIARRILKEGAPAVEGYRRFLAAGGSMPPITALRMAGVDMETPTPVQDALAWFEEILARYEQVC